MYVCICIFGWKSTQTLLSRSLPSHLLSACISFIHWKSSLRRTERTSLDDVVLMMSKEEEQGRSLPEEYEDVKTVGHLLDYDSTLHWWILSFQKHHWIASNINKEHLECWYSHGSQMLVAQSLDIRNSTACNTDRRNCRNI